MPTQTKAAIREAVRIVVLDPDSPGVLINTVSGCLLDRSQRKLSFETHPVYKELISSMTTHIDHNHIQRKVAQYYRYATFSHTWEDNEPLFEQVVRIVVYDLEESLTHDKLRMFCKIVRDSGLHWAWSDTCCINKANHIVLQEALVKMFKWYEGSAVTIVFLRGVHSPSQRGDLMRSIWNTRGWTLQEYHASKVVLFYTEDWKLYLDLDIPNHKRSDQIITEMVEATGISARDFADLRPGSHDIRNKLCLASGRKTTLIEDAAYSLLGCFSVPLPIVYGEGDHALGRLLAQLLTSSGDASVLAWTGQSGTFNTCLPANIAVFKDVPTSHIPGVIEGAEMEGTTARLRASLHLTMVMMLYDRLSALRTPTFADQRMRLPCLAFELGPVELVTQSESGYVFRARTETLGTVEIRTTEDLSGLKPMTSRLVNPWIHSLLDQQPVRRVTETIPENTDSHVTSTVLQTQAAWRVVSHLRQLFGTSLQPPSSVTQADTQLALRVLARLRQPFGALLLTPDSDHVAAYRRVAADSLIIVRVEEITPTILNKLVDSVRILDVR